MKSLCRRANSSLLSQLLATGSAKNEERAVQLHGMLLFVATPCIECYC